VSMKRDRGIRTNTSHEHDLDDWNGAQRWNVWNGLHYLMEDSTRVRSETADTAKNRPSKTRLVQVLVKMPLTICSQLATLNFRQCEKLFRGRSRPM
jgi:hypothetical protein